MSNKTEELLAEILKWIRFVGMKEVKGVFNGVVDTDQKRIAYHYSDGTRGTIEVAKLASIGSTSTVAKFWKSWQKVGLGDNIPVKGGERFKRSFDLEDFGIPIPKVGEVAAQKEGQDAIPLTSGEEARSDA